MKRQKLTNYYKSGNLIFTLLCILNVIFLVYYIGLAYFSYYHYDDLHFIWKLREMSIFEYVKEMYYSRSGRFIAYAINGIVFKTIITTGMYKFISIVFYFFGVLLLWYAVKDYLCKTVSPLFSLNVVLLFYNLYVLTNIDFAVFFWLCALSYYLLMPMCLLMMRLLVQQKCNVSQWIILILITIILGGSQEAFTPIVLSIMFVWGLFLLHSYRYQFNIAIKDKRIIRLLVVTFVMLSCLIVVVIAPGNYLRLADANEFVTPATIGTFVKGTIIAISTFLYFEVFYIPYYFILFLSFIWIGQQTNNRDYFQTTDPLRIILYIVVAYFIYLVLSVLPSVYLWGGFGIQRNYTTGVFVTIGVICCIGFLCGKMKSNVINSFYLHIGICVLIVIMTFNIKNDFISAKTYYESVQNRIVFCNERKQKGVTEEVEVSSLVVPSTIDTKYMFFNIIGKPQGTYPVLYYTSDTSKEPNEYAFHFSKVYGYNFLVKLEE